MGQKKNNPPYFAIFRKETWEYFSFHRGFYPTSQRLASSSETVFLQSHPQPTPCKIPLSGKPLGTLLAQLQQTRKSGVSGSRRDSFLDTRSAAGAKPGFPASGVNFVGLRIKRRAFPRGLAPSRILRVVESPVGIPGHSAGAIPSSAAVPGPLRKRHVCCENLLHTSWVFIHSLPRVRSGRAGNKENARTWRRSEGSLAGLP